MTFDSDFVDVRHMSTSRSQRGGDLSRRYCVSTLQLTTPMNSTPFKNLVVTRDTFGQTLAAFQAKFLVAKASSLAATILTLSRPTMGLD